MDLNPGRAFRRTWHGMGFLGAFVRNVGGPDAAHVMTMERHMSHAATDDELRQFEAALRDHPITRCMLDERWMPAPYTRDDLAACAPGTLGHALRQHLVHNDLDLDFFPDIEPERPEEFLRLRMYQTHDIWHVLAGLGTSDEEELGIVGFYLGQFLTHLAGAGIALSVFTGTLASSVLLNASLLRPETLPTMVAMLADGYQRGGQAKPLMDVRWETLWHEPLAELRQRFGIAEPQAIARARDAA